MSDRPLQMRFDVFDLDEANARLRRKAEVLELPPRAFAVLCELARRTGQLVTKDELLDAVWGHRHVTESVLKSAISQVRAALDDDAKAPRFIETASRRGYRFIAAARDERAPATAAAAADSPRVVAAMTGRGAVLSKLHAAWDQARAGRRQLCWLAGEAGIGKSTLVDHFAASLGAVAVAQGQCVEQHGLGEPYLPVLEALGALCRDDPALMALLRAVAPTWLLQLPWLCSEAERESLQRELAGTSPDRMLREFGELLDRCTQDRPLLLVTEDLHWSDHATVNLINHVARRRGRACLMWLATFRVAEVIAEDHPLKAVRHELRLHGLSQEILVDPFSEQELATYVAQRRGGVDAPDDFLRALYRHTDGLPLFVANVVDDLLAHGALDPGSSPGDVQLTFDALSLPESLAGVMERRIGRMPADQTALLEVASACGIEFRPTVVARVLGRDVEWVARRCDLLAQPQQWLAAVAVSRGANANLEARYAFRHALVRHVFHDRMSIVGRAELHHRVARALEDSPGAGASSAELATQFELGHDPDAALPHAAAAAAQALQQFAPTDALHLADRGLALAVRCRPGDGVRALMATLHTLRGAAAAALHGVGADETLASFERAHAAMQDIDPPHPLRGMALHGLGLGLFLRRKSSRARELAERSRAQALDRQDLVMTVAACDLLGQIIKLEGPPDEAIAVLEQGIQAAGALDENTLQSAFFLDPLVNMQAALAIPLLLAGRDRQALAQSDQALARAAALKQPMARMIATWLAILCDVRRGDRDRVARLAEQLRTITDEGALAQGEGPSQWYGGLVNAWAGAPTQGHAQIEEAYRRYGPVGMSYGAAEVLGYAGEALVLAAAWDRAAQQVDQALQLAGSLDDHSYRCQLLLLRRCIDRARGATQDADAAGRQALLEARRQKAPWLEITALVEICDGPHAASEAMDALQRTVANLKEGSDAPLIRRAHAMLGRG
jgi:DNA-binding winged helix-turn-helix (wHTH) protein